MKKEKRARARRTGAQAAESGAARPAGGAGKTLRALGFAQKLTLAMLLVLAMALSLGGAVVLAGNFDDALNEAGQQAEVQHLLQCYALESDLLDVAARGETVTDSHLARYGSSLEDYVGGKPCTAVTRRHRAGRPPPRRRRKRKQKHRRLPMQSGSPRRCARCIPRFPGTRALRARRILTACTGTAAGRICCSRRRWKPWAIRPSRC